MLLNCNTVISTWWPGKVSGAGVPPYLRSNFNRYGDMIGHWEMKPENINNNGPVGGAYISEYAIEYLAGFMMDCEKKGIKTTFVFPCLRKTNYEKTSRTIAKLEAALRWKIPSMAPSSPAEFAYDDRFFFDTIYHLTAEGRRMRTEKLIEIINAWLNKPSN